MVDPFRGVGDKSVRCGPGDAPLWSVMALARLPYALRVLHNFGVAPERPAPDAVRSGDYRARELPQDAALYALWLEAFAVRVGDRVEMRAVAPDGTPVVDYRGKVEKDQARIFRFAASKRPASAWPAGVYLNVIRIVPGEGPASEVRFSAEVR